MRNCSTIDLSKNNNACYCPTDASTTDVNSQRKWLQLQFGVHVRTLFRLPWQLSTVFDGAWRDLICPCRWVDDSHRQRRMYSGWISLIFYKGTGVMYKHVFEIWITRLICLFGKNPAWYIGIVQVGSQIFWIYHMIFYCRFSMRVFTAQNMRVLSRQMGHKMYSVHSDLYVKTRWSPVHFGRLRYL